MSTSGSLVAKLTMQVTIKAMAKLPPHTGQIKMALGLDEEPDHPPIILQNMNFEK